MQSLTADYYPSSARGKVRAQGLLACARGLACALAAGQGRGVAWQLCEGTRACSLLQAFGALYATNTAAHSPLGIEGWRFVFLSVAVVRRGC